MKVRSRQLGEFGHNIICRDAVEFMVPADNFGRKLQAIDIGQTIVQ